MDSEEVTRIVSALRKYWQGEMGIHTHDNMGRGLNNSLTALNLGVTWLDATITGMGRGAGNTQTESLMAVLADKYTHLNPTAIYELVIRYFESMQKDYGWGTNLLYFLGAQKNVHPTYIQNLLSNSHLGKNEVVGALQYLLEQNGTNKYDGAVLEAALNLNTSGEAVSGDDVSKMFRNKEVLIVTNAESVKKHKKAIELYIEKKKPIVISLNINKILNDEVIDYIAITHNFKFLVEKADYPSLTKPIVYPEHRFSPEDINVIPKNNNIRYGLDVAKGIFNVKESSCVIPNELTIAYALSFALAGGASNITLAGVDGYESNDSRQLEMIEFFELLKDQVNESCNVFSITPTTYPVHRGSVYAYI